MSQELPGRPWLRLRFLGGCEILLPDGPARLETTKTRALLIYLSLNPRPQSRHTLMGLLWGDLPEPKARRNLRRALWNLRRQIAGPQLPPFLLRERDSVCFNQEFPYWSDVEAFEAACVELEAAPLPSLSPPHLAALGRSIDLYSGEFLQGFHVNDARAFGEWVLGEREQLRVKALGALERLVEGYAARNEVEAALGRARQLLILEPWREETHRWLMRLLARSGQRTAALAQYDACRRILAQDLGVEPAPETVALETQIRAGVLGVPASNLPAATTPFVGRHKELTEIAALLVRDDCRLLTVTGLGGVGKTRLALEAAGQQMSSFADGVCYVALGALSSPDRIPAAILQALNVPLLGAEDPQAALVTYLREKRMLVLLDGFEQFLSEASLLSQVLRAAPGVKLLVTSRERLNLHGEWVYVLEGLACAPAGRGEDLALSDAERLFLQTARRVHLGFQVGEGEELHLAHICRLVAGLPLAIELAAAWVRLLSLAEIEAEIAQHLDFLADVMRDRPQRQRSIRAVFDHSWRLLSQEERDAFRRLSVFRGSFRPAEAGQVSGASLPILSALVDKSLLQRLPSGRYQLHELLRQYAQEQLERLPGEEKRARDLHCQTYAAPLGRYQQALKDAGRMPILRLSREEVENVQAAWRWAIEQRNYGAIEAMQAGLADYYHLTTSFQEGEALFRQALADLGGVERDETQGLLPWKLLSSQASFAVYLGRFAPARASLERCLAAFARHGVQGGMAHCRFFLGEIARFTGDNAAAAGFFEQSLSDYRQVGNRSAVGFCLNGLGLASAARGELDRARSYLQESLAAFRAIDHEMGTTIASINLADLLFKLGEYGAATEILEESYSFCERLGHRWGMAVCVRNLGDIARLEGRATEAQAAYEQSLGILRDIGQRQAAAGCLIKLGGVCSDRGEYAEAGQHLQEALAISAELQDRAQMLEAAATLALLLSRAGDGERALELALAVEGQPAEAPAAQERASRLAAELRQRLPEETWRPIQERSRTRALGDVLASWGESRSLSGRGSA